MLPRVAAYRDTSASPITVGPQNRAGLQLSSIHERADARTEWANGFDGVDTADLRKCPCQKFPEGFNRHDRLFDHGRLLWYGAICDAAEDRASARKRSELTGPITFDSGRDEQVGDLRGRVLAKEARLNSHCSLAHQSTRMRLKVVVRSINLFLAASSKCLQAVIVAETGLDLGEESVSGLRMPPQRTHEI